MKTQIIMSIVGRDKNGLFNDLTLKTKELGGRWLANKVNHLDGHVAGILKVEIDADQLDNLKRTMADISGITVDFHEVLDSQQPAAKSVHMTIEGEDRSGLTSDITRILYEQDVKVEHFESERFPVIGLGTGVFEAQLSVRLPTTLALDTLREKLESLGGSLRVFLSKTA